MRRGTTRLAGGCVLQYFKVTCEVVEPRPSRPNEGKLSIAVHLSPMAAPHLEPGRTNDVVDELQQILDRNIKESRCLDLESLCIQAEESVWQLRLDVTVLNHAGNLGDACNLASVAALRHFHRPDVTVEADGRVTVHTLEERQPVPTFMRKVPVCLTYAFFMEGEKCHVVMDPTEQEERVMCGRLVVGLNPHGEITSLLFPGRVVMEKQTLLSCIRKAFSKAKSVAESVQQAVDDDLAKRKAAFVKPSGFVVKNLRSDPGYNRWLVDQRVSQKRLKLEDNEVPMEEEMSDSLEESTKQPGNIGDSDHKLQMTPSDRSPHMEMDGDMADGIEEEDENDDDGEEEDVKSKLTAKDLL
ncbi:exosome complex component RRP45A-like isoform X2 [Portunus trituberculatus]|uniref:exosome complex component RRP45A-like isoform X2 n=1 Tax=Portunus trituberculatus TaxID=210409 RepID=UPI001E1CE9AD|nr:exosome complex component RRP45A-like isoform X2 [Portunus trituberculatus]